MITTRFFELHGRIMHTKTQRNNIAFGFASPNNICPAGRLRTFYEYPKNFEQLRIATKFEFFGVFSE